VIASRGAFAQERERANYSSIVWYEVDRGQGGCGYRGMTGCSFSIRRDLLFIARTTATDTGFFTGANLAASPVNRLAALLHI